MAKQLSFVIFVFGFFIAQETNAHVNQNKGYVECEPRGISKKKGFFLSKYNLSLQEPGFIYRISHRSNHYKADIPLGKFDKEMGLKVAHDYLVIQNLKKTDHIEKYRTQTYTLVFHFYHGDTATCHVFNPTTREYTRTQIGFHTNNFVCVAKAGHYYTLDFEKHLDEKHVFLGVIFFKEINKSGEIAFYTKEDFS